LLQFKQKTLTASTDRVLNIKSLIYFFVVSTVAVVAGFGAGAAGAVLEVLTF
jgi:hypothetical protein